MIGTSDPLGRLWSHAKLDQLLADPDVQRVVAEAESAAYGATGTSSEFNVERFHAWGLRQRRSRSGMALLFLLIWRAAGLGEPEGDGAESNPKGASS